MYILLLIFLCSYDVLHPTPTGLRPSICLDADHRIQRSWAEGHRRMAGKVGTRWSIGWFQGTKYQENAITSRMNHGKIDGFSVQIFLCLSTH